MKNNFKIFFTIFILLFSISAFAQNIMIRETRIENAISDINSKNITKTIEDLVSFQTRHNLSNQIDISKGIGAAATYIQKQLENLAKSSEHLVVQRVKYAAGGVGTRLGREIQLMNIVADFQGTNKNDDRVIILLAHFDSRSFDNNDSLIFAPGANDNGSGVAILMETARILSKNPLPISVKLIFLSGEEHGLLGAAHMASVAKNEKWNIIAVINNDMIGNSRSSGTEISGNTRLRVFSENIPVSETPQMKRVREFNSSENDSDSRQLARYIKEIAERYVDNLRVSLIYRNDRFGRGGDHTPFNREGFISVRLCEYYENYDRTHQIVQVKDGKEFGDLIKGVDIEYVRKNAQANLASIMNIGFAPDKPQNVKLNTVGLSSSTLLTWEAPTKGTPSAGYYVLIRETDKSMWEKKIFVKSTSIEIPYSKDNYFFAVQSVSMQGNESIAVLAIGGSSR